jgi:ubiquinone/menaquinone biosynthesis C-methylase UbiE
MTTIDDSARQTAATRARYNRIAPMYDAMEWFAERGAFSAWRRQLWAAVPPGRVLEVGVGTGKNLPYYPPAAQVTAIDLSERMLERARHRAASLRVRADLRLMDVQRLEFPGDVFDTAVATFVFCSVPDPVAGLRELGRVVRADGDIWLLEHMRVDKPFIGPLMDLLNPLVVRVMGANINRRTVENVRRAGLKLVKVTELRGELVRLIHAQP